MIQSIRQETLKRLRRLEHRTAGQQRLQLELDGGIFVAQSRFCPDCLEPATAEQVACEECQNTIVTLVSTADAEVVWRPKNISEQVRREQAGGSIAWTFE